MGSYNRYSYLVLGAGQLGTEFRFYPYCTVLSRSECDITNDNDIKRAIYNYKPSVIINCAAYTHIDEAEGTGYSLARIVNSDSVCALANVCDYHDIKFVHFSTDHVFGKWRDAPFIEDDEPSPINTYGLTKWIGEEHMSHIGGRQLIIRTSCLYGPSVNNFVYRVLYSKGPIKAIDDQKSKPTYTRDLAEATMWLLSNDATGIYHVCNAGHATYYDLATEVIKYRNDGAILIPISTVESGMTANRPRDSRLCTDKLKAAGLELRDWRLALASYMQSGYIKRWDDLQGRPTSIT